MFFLPLISWERFILSVGVVFCKLYVDNVSGVINVACSIDEVKHGCSRVDNFDLMGRVELHYGSLGNPANVYFCMLGRDSVQISRAMSPFVGAKYLGFRSCREGGCGKFSMSSYIMGAAEFWERLGEFIEFNSGEQSDFECIDASVMVDGGLTADLADALGVETILQSEKCTSIVACGDLVLDLRHLSRMSQEDITECLTYFKETSFEDHFEEKEVQEPFYSFLEAIYSGLSCRNASLIKSASEFVALYGTSLR